ncbi:MAG: hypothetical protein IPI64_10545 [Chloracidobacterium sp.]|nr:hypothetical protein [Chloracidobacterium sp.]
MKTNLSLLVIASFFFALLPLPSSVAAQDLVATDDIAGGSSVFVFRGSRKAPQARAGGARHRWAKAVDESAAAQRRRAARSPLSQRNRADAIAARKRPPLPPLIKRSRRQTC